MSLDSTTNDYSYLSGERQVAPDIDGIRFDHRARYQLACDFLKKHVQAPERLAGLDAFCGNGYGSFMLSSELGCHCLGIDACSEAIAFGNVHFGRESTFFVHKQYPFRLPKGRFDFATCFESIEHVADDVGLMREISGSLKPGGLLFVSTPNENVISLEKNPHPFHFRHYRPADLIAQQAEIGLEPIACFGQDAYAMSPDGKQGAILPESEMRLREDYEGQFQVHVFQTPATRSSWSVWPFRRSA